MRLAAQPVSGVDHGTCDKLLGVKMVWMGLLLSFSSGKSFLLNVVDTPGVACSSESWAFPCV